VGDAGETSLPYAVWIGDEAPAERRAPFATGSYDLSRAPQAGYRRGFVTGDYSPRPRPLPMRNPPPLLAPVKPEDVHTAQLVPVKYGDEYRFERTAAGGLSAFCRQDYPYNDMTRPVPITAHLDGPRGVGALSMTTHISPGRNGKWYVTTAHRFCRVTAAGHITTLAGWVDDSPPDQWEVTPRRGRLVGDWSAIPPERHGFKELWGMAWDERTLLINEDAAPIPTEGNEKPHIVGPVCFLSDSQNGRIIKLEFPATFHGEPKVTEFIVGLADAWDVVYADGVLYVSERGSHRIAAYDATTGAYLRTVVQGRALAVVDKNREVRPLAPLAERRLEPCVAPEGLFWQDGWLYFSGVAQGDVRRVRPDGSGLEVLFTYPIDGNTLFAKIAVGNESCMPGAVAVARWSPGDGGMARIVLADRATVWPIGAHVAAARKGGGWPHHYVYASAVAFGPGGIAVGGANEGLQVISRRLPDEPVITEAARLGEKEWRDSGLIMPFGEAGFGQFDTPLPWGKSPNIDAYLIQHGHTQ
jgi:hypothetical protein